MASLATKAYRATAALILAFAFAVRSEAFHAAVSVAAALKEVVGRAAAAAAAAAVHLSASVTPIGASGRVFAVIGFPAVEAHFEVVVAVQVEAVPSGVSGLLCVAAHMLSVFRAVIASATVALVATVASASAAHPAHHAE